MKRIWLLLATAICSFAFGLSDAQDTTVTRDGGTADWRCCSDKSCTTILTQNADAVRAFKACEALVKSDGVPRWFQSWAFRVTRINATPPVSGEATLTWTQPTMRTNNVVLPASDIVGYTIYYGTSPAALSQSVTVGPVITTKITNLAPGTWYFSITCIALSEQTPRVNEESARSNPASKII